MKRNMVSILLALMLCLSAAAPAQAASSTFSDVPPTHWAYESIQRAADNGWVKGTGDNRFDPTGTVSNAQWIVMVTRAYYADEVERIAILGNSEHWWSPYCSAAAVNGVLEATTIGDSYFAEYKWDEELLNTPINRYDMAQVALNFMSGNDFTVSEAQKKAAQAKIGDWAEIPVEYRDGVSACYALGVISGRSDGTFGGERPMSRAEAVTVLARLADSTGNGSTPTPEPTPTPTPEPTPTPKPSGSYAPADANKDGILTEDEVYEALMAFKEEVPAGTPWTVDNYYSSVAGRGTGCAAFVYQASDHAFNLPKREVSNVNDLRVGDLIHVISPSHWVIVTSIDSESYHYADGSSESDGTVRWDGAGSLELLTNGLSDGRAVIYTRYPR